MELTVRQSSSLTLVSITRSSLPLVLEAREVTPTVGIPSTAKVARDPDNAVRV